MKPTLGDPLTPLPWRSRLPRRIGSQSTSIAEFQTWPLQKGDEVHLGYVEMCSRILQRSWQSPWQQIYAVGPFTGRKIKHRAVPFVVFARYRNFYRQILTLSQVLSDAYVEFGILPDIHLFPARAERSLEATRNRDWIVTRSISIRVGRSE
jgi:hypothetical protein